MMLSVGVYSCHFAAEQLSVSTRVSPLIDSDIVMNHLMQNSVIYQLFRQVNPRIDPKGEILIPIIPKEPPFAANKSDLSQETFGIGQFDRDRRQCTPEKTGVVLIKSGLYVVDGRCHMHKSGAKIVLFQQICKPAGIFMEKMVISNIYIGIL